MLLTLAIAPRREILRMRLLDEPYPRTFHENAVSSQQNGAPSASLAALWFGAPKMYTPSTWDKVCSSIVHQLFVTMNYPSHPKKVPTGLQQHIGPISHPKMDNMFKQSEVMGVPSATHLLRPTRPEWKHLKALLGLDAISLPHGLSWDGWHQVPKYPANLERSGKKW